MAPGSPATVKVLIPTRNRAEYLRHSIASVLGQTWTDVHLVVSDNASTDDTPDVAAGFDDPRLEYVRLPEDVGLLNNFNRCLEDVRSPYVLVLADDELLYPEHLARSVEALERNPRVGMVHCAFDVVGPTGEVIFPASNWMEIRGPTNGTVIEPGHDFVRECLLSWSRVAASTALMRTEALPEVKFDPLDFPPTDFGLWLRLALDWDIAFLPSTLAAYRIHPNSHSAAYGTYTPSGYIDTPEHLLKGEEVKLRFLRRYGDRLGGSERLATAARRWTRQALINRVARLTLPDRDRLETMRLLVEAARLRPGVAVDRAAWRLMGASLLGPRLVDRLKQGARSPRSLLPGRSARRRP